jgi:hypothetical protein
MARYNYTVVGVERVFDENGEFERTKGIEGIVVEASSVRAAVGIGREALQSKVDDYRKKSGDMEKGMFIAVVKEIRIGNEVVFRNGIDYGS